MRTLAERYCAAIANEGNAVWPAATAGSTVQGACITANGYEGIAVRTCSATAVWGAITTACTAIQPACASVIGYNSRTNWPSTTAGSTATGTCALGYTFGDNGAPLRQCIGSNTGAWNSTVVNDCVFCKGDPLGPCASWQRAAQMTDDGMGGA